MEDLGRREFIKQSATAVSAVTACLCGLSGCAAYTKVSNTPAASPAAVTVDRGTLIVNLAKEPHLSEVGGAVKVLHADIPDGVIIARIAQDRYAAVSLLCTHRGVELEYEHPRGHFQCPSLGGSVFALDGANVGGLAGRPLKDYDAIVENGMLSIRLDGAA
ncbi:MAG: Rieske 2Fe-2S domain-containing protein [Gammaproteobacteria bacterium]|nr:Rieske 2Fe-2S domain-containing protein [Gammaproteobacteria bacterium]